MDKTAILTLINEAHIAYLATVDGKAGRVRGMETYRADENGLIFYTGKVKEVYKQMVKNPDVEVCYFHKGTQVRVRGRMEILDDIELKKEVYAKRDFLKPLLNGDLTNLVVCRLKGKATTWTMNTNTLAPAAFIEI